MEAIVRHLLSPSSGRLGPPGWKEGSSRRLCLDGWMDGWMDGLMDGWIDGFKIIPPHQVDGCYDQDEAHYGDECHAPGSKLHYGLRGGWVQKSKALYLAYFLQSALTDYASGKA